MVAVPVTGLDLRREFRALWRAGTTGADVRGFVRLARQAEARRA
jgi:hypothetical protein